MQCQKDRGTACTECYKAVRVSLQLSYNRFIFWKYNDPGHDLSCMQDDFVVMKPEPSALDYLNICHHKF